MEYVRLHLTETYSNTIVCIQILRDNLIWLKWILKSGSLISRSVNLSTKKTITVTSNVWNTRSSMDSIESSWLSSSSICRNYGWYPVKARVYRCKMHQTWLQGELRFSKLVKDRTNLCNPKNAEARLLGDPSSTDPSGQLVTGTADKGVECSAAVHHFQAHTWPWAKNWHASHWGLCVLKGYIT